MHGIYKTTKFYYFSFTQDDYVVTPFEAIMNSSKIAATINTVPGCSDGPACT